MASHLCSRLVGVGAVSSPHPLPTAGWEGLVNSACRCFISSSPHLTGLSELAVSSLRSSPSEESRAVGKSPVSLLGRVQCLFPEGI